MNSLKEKNSLKGISIREALRFGKSVLEKNAIPQPLEEIQSFLKYLTGLSHTGLILEDKKRLSSMDIETFSEWINRRAQGEPFSYILQNQPFWDDEFFVPRGVFIPRPETELIVEETLRLKPIPEWGLDLCTGTGCLAITLSRLIPGIQMVAVDISKKAITIARENARQKKIEEKIVFLEGDLFFPLQELKLKEQFDLIVANPPYVATETYGELPEGVRNFEPFLALLGGSQGREVIERILKDVSIFLKPNGYLLIEVGMGQSNMINEWLEEKKIPITIEKVIKDLSGIDRVLVFRRAPSFQNARGIIRG